MPLASLPCLPQDLLIAKVPTPSLPPTPQTAWLEIQPCALLRFSVYRPQSGWEMGVEKGATSDSIVVEPEHEQPTAYQLRYECLTTIMISADRGYNQITVLKQYCTINTYGGLSHPGRLTHISPHRVSPESRIYSSPVFSPAPRGAQGRLSLLWARVPEIPAKLYRLWTLWTVRGALGADLAQPAHAKTIYRFHTGAARSR
jgi:hypothetical protein